MGFCFFALQRNKKKLTAEEVLSYEVPVGMGAHVPCDVL